MVGISAFYILPFNTIPVFAEDVSTSLTVGSIYDYDSSIKYVEVVYKGASDSSNRDGDTYSISTWGKAL